MSETKDGDLCKPSPMISHSIIPCQQIVKVVGRNFDDTDAEILCKKAELEQREALRIRFQDIPSNNRAGRNLARKERVAPSGFYGIPKVVYLDQVRPYLVLRLVNKSCNYQRKRN